MLFTACFLLFGWNTSVAVQEETMFDSACGPRCVKHLLEKFDIEHGIELIGLVRELHDPHSPANGNSLAELKDFLQSKGLKTWAFRKKMWHELSGAPAYLIHVTNAQGEGHYILRENVRGQYVYWDGSYGFSKSFPESYERSGVVLAVSPSSISKPVKAIFPAVFWFAICVVFTSLVWYRRHCLLERTRR
jgi:hypothetical protein